MLTALMWLAIISVTFSAGFVIGSAWHDLFDTKGMNEHEDDWI